MELLASAPVTFVSESITANHALYIGLMSGTSLDGVDGVLVALPERAGLAGADAELVPIVQGFVHHEFDAALRRLLIDLQPAQAAGQGGVPGSIGEDLLHLAACAGQAVARAYALVTLELLARTGVPAAAVRAIGAHGQTVRHRPPGVRLASMASVQSPEAAPSPMAASVAAAATPAYSLQLLDAALLAELTGVAVVHDFRSRDLAAGGQGAPLVPLFHAAIFRPRHGREAVCNLGGMANVTLLDASGAVLAGFDTGPGNALLDAWCARHLGQAFDRDGAWAASGRVHEGLLRALLDEPYFRLAPPKSTGRDLFDRPWLDARLQQVGEPAIAPNDVQATLAELTAASIARALGESAIQRLWLCGGGAFNRHLVGRIAARCGVPTAGTAARGVPEDQVEALAFAYLAQCHLLGRPGNVPNVTGARAARVLGSLTPA